MKKLIILASFLGVVSAQACPTFSGKYICSATTGELSPTFEMVILTSPAGVVTVVGANSQFEMNGSGQLETEMNNDENGTVTNFSKISQCTGDDSIGLKTMSESHNGTSSSHGEISILFKKLSENKLEWTGQSKSVIDGVVETVNLSPTICTK